MTALVCVCGHPQGRHLLDRRDCRSCRECSAFEQDDTAGVGPEPKRKRTTKPRSAAAPVIDVAALLGEVQADADREAELASRLAEVEQERDQLAALVDQKQHRLGEYSDLLTAARARAESVERERDAAQAKLDSALLVAAEKIAAGQARIAELEALLEHAEQHARDLQDNGVVPVDEPVYDEHIRHLCRVCGGRYREVHQHPCGPLVPVRVRITFVDT